MTLSGVQIREFRVFRQHFWRTLLNQLARNQRHQCSSPAQSGRLLGGQAQPLVAVTQPSSIESRISCEWVRSRVTTKRSPQSWTHQRGFGLTSIRVSWTKVHHRTIKYFGPIDILNTSKMKNIFTVFLTLRDPIKIKDQNKMLHVSAYREEFFLNTLGSGWVAMSEGFKGGFGRCHCLLGQHLNSDFFADAWEQKKLKLCNNTWETAESPSTKSQRYRWPNGSGKIWICRLKSLLNDAPAGTHVPCPRACPGAVPTRTPAWSTPRWRRQLPLRWGGGGRAGCREIALRSSLAHPKPVSGFRSSHWMRAESIVWFVGHCMRCQALSFTPNQSAGSVRPIECGRRVSCDSWTTVCVTWWLEQDCRDALRCQALSLTPNQSAGSVRPIKCGQRVSYDSWVTVCVACWFEQCC